MPVLRTLLKASATVVLLAATVAACSGGGAAASATPPPGVDAMIAAQNSLFAGGTITLPADRPTRVFFKNLDGLPHNVAIFTDASATKSVFVGETITNAATTYDLPSIAAGSYFFRCDVHPAMTGTISVGG